MHRKQGQALSARTDFQTGGVTAFSVGHATHDTYTGFLPALLPLFIQYLGFTKTEAGMLSMFIQAPSLVQPVIGHAADKRNLYKIVFFTPAIAAIFMSLLTRAPSFWILAGILTFVGLNSAVIHAVGPVITGKLSGENLGRGMSFWMVGGELGRTLGPVIIVSAVHFLGFEHLGWLMIPGIGMSIFLYARFQDLTIEHSRHPDTLPLKQALNQMKRIMIPLSVFLCIRSFMMVSITTYLPIYLTEKGEGLFFAGAALSILEAAGVVGALSGGSLSDKLGRRNVLFISSLSSSILMLSFTLIHGVLLLPVLILLGFASFSITPVVMALVQESFPANRALANGVYMASNLVLRSLVIVLVGIIGDHAGLHTAYLFSSGIMAAGILVIFFLPKRSP
ncbi:MAG: MFS transporter [Spirochaetales bacterium]